MNPKIETILWDFDGVILDSMSVRDWGFKEIFKEFGQDEVMRLLAFHRANGGLSRYVKIRYFFEKILLRSITNEKVLAYANAFSVLMKRQLINPDNLIEDSVNFIKLNYSKYNFHIVSGSDEEELRFLCKELDLHTYFISINGSPTPKKELVCNLIKQFNYNMKTTCLIGDSINDFEAANENSIAFYGYNNIRLKTFCKNYIKSFDNFNIEV